MFLFQNNNANEIIDKHFSVKCPHCRAFSGLSAISIPRFELLERYKPKSVGIAYQCDACQETVFLRFSVLYSFHNNQVTIYEDFSEIERPKEDYEFKYLPEETAEDFKEALVCFSSSCFNAFAAMCRRTIQSACIMLGAEGKKKISDQLHDLKKMNIVEEETFEILNTIVVAGHDGVHPNLPPLSPERAKVLLQLMKDVLDQLFVRKMKIQEAIGQRNDALAQKKKNTQGNPGAPPQAKHGMGERSEQEESI